MYRNLFLFVVVTMLLSGCVSTAPKKSCSFIFDAEVDGVAVSSPLGGTQISQAGKRLEFTLPCGLQSFRLKKACYPSQQAAVASGEDGIHRLTAHAWEKHGYVRLENASASKYVELRNLPGGALRADANKHSVRRMPLGEYSVRISAPYKDSVQRELMLCTEDEIYSLRVGTEKAEGELVAEGAKEVMLNHGSGQLRVVTETPNLEFRIEPEMSESLRRYVYSTGVQNFLDLNVDEVPDAVKTALKLMQRFHAKTLLAPTALKLPAGKYYLQHSLQTEDETPLQVEVHPNREARVEL